MRKNKEGNESSTVVPSNGFFILPQCRIGSDEGNCGEEVKAENKSEVAEIEVTVIQTHVNLKIHSQRRPGQLLKAIVALEDLRLTVLHLNITSSESSVLYSFNLKVLVCLFLFLFSQPFWLEDQATLVLVTFFFFFFLFSYIILRLSVILIYIVVLFWTGVIWCGFWIWLVMQMEDECKLGSADEIASKVHQIFSLINGSWLFKDSKQIERQPTSLFGEGRTFRIRQKRKNKKGYRD